MRTLALVVTLAAVAILVESLGLAQKSSSSDALPVYELSKESSFTGIIDEVNDRTCPISRGIGSHLIVNVESKIYEVHVAPVGVMKMYKTGFHKGDVIEIVGVKVNFQGRDAILVRQIKRGTQEFSFRDNHGEPFW